MKNTKNVVILAGNFAIVALVILFWGLDKIPGETAIAIVAALGFPSIATVFVDPKKKPPPAPPAIAIIVAIGVCELAFPACKPPEVPQNPECEPGAYGAGLETCTAMSRTLEESIACENALRARCGRPQRKYPGVAQ